MVESGVKHHRPNQTIHENEKKANDLPLSKLFFPAVFRLIIDVVSEVTTVTKTLR